MIDGQGLMVVMDVLGKQLAQAEYENAQLAQKIAELREQLQAHAGADANEG